MAKAADSSTAVGMPSDGEEHRVRHEVLHRREDGGRQHDEAEEPEGPGRVGAVEAVVAPPDERDGHQRGERADRHHQAPPERADPVVLPQEEAGQHRHGEQPEPDRREGDDRGPQRADPDELGEGRFHARSARGPRRRSTRRAGPASRTGPRGGSGRRKATTATIAAGTAMTRKAHCQPWLPPASAATPPTSSGLSATASRPAIDSDAHTRPRVPIGYWSASSDPCTGSSSERATPRPTRARKIVSAVVATPASITSSEKTRLAQPMMRRDDAGRPAQPIGTDASATTRPDTALIGHHGRRR